MSNTVTLTRRSAAGQMQYCLEQIRDQAATKVNGGAWAAGVATLCLATIPGEKASEQFSYRWAVETVLKSFKDSEAAGFRSRDRQYAIDILAKAVEVNTGSGHD